MAVGRIPLLTDSQRSGSSRNDQPNSLNNIIFSFILNQNSSDHLHISGPSGFIFASDCLPSVVTGVTEVFGSHNRWPPEYALWPESVIISSCTGSGPTANLTIGSGTLTRHNEYVFRISVTNPERTPESNLWQISTISEISDKFRGFMIWTFPILELNTTSVARTPRNAGYVPVPATISLQFLSTNAIPTGGVLALTAPVGFSVYSENCDGVSLSSLSGWDFFGDFVPELPFHNLICSSPTSNVLHVQVVSGSLEVKSGYALSALFLNPANIATASDWRFETFNSASESFDLGFPIGYQVINVLQSLSYSNIDRFDRPQIDGGQTVLGMTIQAIFYENINIGDVLHLVAPEGFFLSGIASSIAASITRSMNSANITVSAMIGSGSSLTLTLNTTNPETTPSPNFWSLTQVSGAVPIASQIFYGWTVIPALVNVSIRFAGESLTAANSIGAHLMVNFTAVSQAEAVVLSSLSGISFNSAQLSSESNGSLVSSTSSTLTVSVPISAGKSYSLSLSGITLGGGGAAMFSLETLMNGIVQDELFNFQGFRQPGKISVSFKKLESVQLGSLYVPNAAMWGICTNHNASALFSFSSSVRLLPSMNVTINGGGFRLLGSLQVSSSSGTNLPISTPSLSSDNILTAALGVAVSAGTVLTVKAGVTAPGSPSLASQNWLISISDGEALPVSTNDKLTPGFTVVETVGLSVSADRSPPLANITVSVNIAPSSSTASLQFQLVAPVGYFFPGCLVSGIVVLSCSTQPLMVQRSSIIVVPAFAIQTDIAIKVSVTSPANTPNDNIWFVSLVGTGNVQVGWGASSISPLIVQMPNCKVSYGQLLSINSEVLFTFQTTVLVQGGAALTISVPFGFSANCALFNKISLPLFIDQIATACNWHGGTTANPNLNPYLTMNFPNDMIPGVYAFSVGMLMPVETPASTSFSFTLKDSLGAVIDGAVSVSGPKFVNPSAANAILVQMSSKPSNLVWSPILVASSIVYVTLSFQFVQQVTLRIGGVGPLRSILISFPPGFVSAAESASDIENLSGLPVDNNSARVGGPFADITQPDSLLVYIDNTLKIPIGTYALTVPVYAPVQTPAVNVWYVSFCGVTGGCKFPTDSGVICSFPNAGFELTDKTSTVNAV